MASEIDTIVETLRRRTPEDVNQAYAVVDRMSRESRVPDLLALAAALEAASEGPALASFEAVADHVEEVLALSPGVERIDALFTLLGTERTRSVQRPRPRDTRIRAFASRLGHGQSKDALLASIGRAEGRHTEVLACWMHEVVLRGTALDREPTALGLQRRLVDDQHPLGDLPLVLLAAEAEAPTYMPMYGANAISKAIARLETGPASARTMPPPGEQSPPTVTLASDASSDKRLLEAVQPWTSGSNGRAEAKVFTLTPPIGGAAPGRWLLRALPLTCLEKAQGLRAERAGSEAVWGALFAAAANGGAYSSGLGGAYGRRAAWTSLGALVDAPGAALASDIDALADRCSFLVFGASRGDGADGEGFFYDVAWDVGVLAVRSGGGSVAVLAATDSD
ncbi:MAG: hypothetical protein JWP97_5058 [Labilithrix sp.]|nr:hypothetical protein [Labilithrix sp.]